MFLTWESKAELLWPNIFILDSAEQRLHFHYEQIRTVLPGFSHSTDILKKDTCERRMIQMILSLKLLCPAVLWYKVSWNTWDFLSWTTFVYMSSDKLDLYTVLWPARYVTSTTASGWI